MFATLKLIICTFVQIVVSFTTVKSILIALVYSINSKVMGHKSKHNFTKVDGSVKAATSVCVKVSTRSISIQNSDGMSIDFLKQDSHQISTLRVPVYELMIK